MHIAFEILLIVVGVVAVFIVLDAALRTFVLPRGAPVLFTIIIFRSVHATLSLFARPNRSYEARDRVMALYAPLALLTFPAVALVIVFLAFACFFEASEVNGWHDALLTSGSSLFTLGFERPAGLGSAFIAFTEAAIGLGLLAVLIAYLPTIYGSFSRREAMVTQLSVRAGTPPTAWRALELAHRAGYLNDLDPVWNEWMQWFCELSETHTSLGALAFFRSPNPQRSWITAAGTHARRGRAAAVGAQHPVHARSPGCASAPGSSRCARSPTSSGSTTTPTRRPTIRSASPARSSSRSTSGSRPRGSPYAPTASVRGATSRAGASTTTGCCSRCAAW